MNKQIILINGSNEKYIQELINLTRQSITVDSYSTSDKINDIIKMYNIDPTLDNSKEFLRKLKQLIEKYTSINIEEVEERIEEFINSNYKIFFMYIEDEKVSEKIRKKYNAKTLLIKDDNQSNVYGKYDYSLLNSSNEVNESKVYELIGNINRNMKNQ